MTLLNFPGVSQINCNPHILRIPTISFHKNSTLTARSSNSRPFLIESGKREWRLWAWKVTPGGTGCTVCLQKLETHWIETLFGKVPSFRVEKGNSLIQTLTTETYVYRQAFQPPTGCNLTGNYRKLRLGNHKHHKLTVCALMRTGKSLCSRRLRPGCSLRL